MAVNRYTSLTPSKFNPLSLEEIMLVPSMKRQQHNDILAKQEIIRGELAKVNPLDVHFDEAVKLREEMNNKLTAQAEQLANSGIDPNSQGQFLALNREYQNLTGPTGRLGQINNAFKIEAEEKKKFFENPAYKDYGVDALERAWKKHRSIENYSGYDAEGNITNIGMLSAPKYEDMQKDFMELSSILGEDTKTYLNNIGAHFQPGPFGGLIMVSADGKTINTSNDKNLDALAKKMEAKYLKEQGEGYKSREFAGYDKQNTLDQLNNMLNIPRVDKTLKDLNYSYQNINNPFAGTESETQGGLVDTVDAPYDFDGTVGKAISTINSYEKGLKEGKSFTPEEDAQYNNAKESYAAFEKVKDNPEMYAQNKNGVPIGEFYGKKLGVKNADLNFAKRKYEQSKTQFLVEYEKQYGKDSDVYKEAKSIIDNGGSKGYFDNAFKRSRLNTQELTKLKHNFESKVKKYNDIYYNYRNDVFANNNAYTPGYTFVRTDKMNNTLEGIERTLTSLFSTPGTTNHQGIFTGITTNGKKYRNLTTDDKEALSKVLNSGIDKMEFVQVLPNSSSGLPKIEFKVKGNKNMISEDIKESFWENDPTIGGTEGEFNIEIDLNRFSNISDKNYVGTTNILTQLIPIIRESNPIVADQMQRAIYERGKGVGTKK